MGFSEKRARDRRRALATIASVLSVSPDTAMVKAFTSFGGRVRLSAGSHLARLYGITATCTESEVAAVKAWLKKAEQETCGA